MKYEILEKNGQLTKPGDEWSNPGEGDWTPAPVGMKLAPDMGCDYRRPIPEKKAAAVDWKRVAARMKRELDRILMQSYNRHAGMQFVSVEQIQTDAEFAKRIYTRALAREKRSRK